MEQQQEAPIYALTRDDPKPKVGFWQWLPDLTLVKPVLVLALPVVLGMATQSAINILDTVMVGRLPTALANPGQTAIGFSLPIMWFVGGFLSSIWVGTQALTSRRMGEGRVQAAGEILPHSLLISASSGLLASALAAYWAPDLIGYLYQNPTEVALGGTYLQIRMLGVFAMATTFSFKSFFDGIGHTRVFMTVALVMNLLNVLLNALLIFGYAPLHIPMLGVEGAAWASVISAYTGLLMLVAWSLLPRLRRRFGHYQRRRFRGALLLELIRLSLPNGAATLVMMVGFEAFYWVAGQVGERAAGPVAATHQVLVTTVMVGFMTALAFGSGTGALVGQALGAKRPFLAECYAREAAKFWGFLMGLYGVAMWVFPDLFLGAVSLDPEVIALGRVPLRMLAAQQWLVAIAIVLAQTLYAVGSSTFVMRIEFVLHLFVMAPAAYLFGWVLQWDLAGVFMGPTLYGGGLALAMLWKFRKGDWKTVVV